MILRYSGPLPKKHGLARSVWCCLGYLSYSICFVSKSLRNLDQKGIGLTDWITLGWTIGGPMTTRKKTTIPPWTSFPQKNIYISFVLQESLTIFSFPSQSCFFLPNQNHPTTKNLLILGKISWIPLVAPFCYPYHLGVSCLRERRETSLHQREESGGGGNVRRSK